MFQHKQFAPKKLALAIGFISAQAISPTFAQPTEENDASSDLRLEEVIVTAQKRSESVQDVPLSVSAISGEKLNDAGIENLEDLTAYMPNIHFTESGFSTQVRTRGIGSDNSQGFEQSVGMYVDDIYYGRAQLFRAPMMDMTRAELLRGPQVTLFGKNSIAGALNLTTAKPTEDFEGRVSLSHEFEHSQTEFNGVVSGPLSDTFRARLAVRAYQEDGYMLNTYDPDAETFIAAGEKGRRQAETEESTARLTLEWTPTDDLALVLKAEQNNFETEGRAIEITRDTEIPDTRQCADIVEVGSPVNTDLDICRNYNGMLAAFGQPPAFERNLNYERQTDIPEFSDNEITNITLKVDYEIGDYTLTGVTGLLEFNYDELCDCDFTSAEILELNLHEEYEQLSQEIRITSPVGETVEWIAGLFYQTWEQEFNDELSIYNTNLLPELDTALTPMYETGFRRDFSQSSDSLAAFARLTWNVTDELSVNIGGRFTDEDKKAEKEVNIVDVYTSEPLPILDPNNPTPETLSSNQAGIVYQAAFLAENQQVVAYYPDPQDTSTFIPFLNTGHAGNGERNESNFDPMLAVEYDVTPDLMTYVSYKEGFKAGGFDPRSNSIGAFSSLTPPTTQPDENLFFEFDEETAVAYELGFKSSLADGRGEVNVALYRTDYENLQISQFDGGVGFNVGNAAKTIVQGIELDGRWLIANGLTASYGVAYLDFNYDDFQNGNCHAGQTPDGVDLNGDGIIETCDYTGKRGVYTPEYTVNFSLDYIRNIKNDINFVGFIDLQRVDSHNVHVNLDPAGEIDAYNMLNMRAGIESEMWSVALLGKNLLDEEIISYSANAPLSDTTFGANTFYSFIRRPRTIALEAVFKF